MLRRVACLLTLLCLFILRAQAQPATQTPRQPRILLLLDGSSSMLQPWAGNEIRFKAAARIVEGLMDSIYRVNPDVEFGLRVYGHQSPAQNNDCYDSRMEVMFSKNNITQMGLRLASLRPYGVSPIAYSLRQAAEYDLLDDARNAYAIILITDGGESCGGNICDVVQKLLDRKIYFRPYVVSLVDYAPLKEQYACFGSYLKIAKPEDIGPSLNQIVDAYRPMLSMPIIGSGKPVRPVVQPAIVPVDVPTLPVTVKVPELRKAETTAVLNIRGLRLVRVPARAPLRLAGRIPVPEAPVFVYDPEQRGVDTIPDVQPAKPGAMTVVKQPERKPGLIATPDRSRPAGVPLDNLNANTKPGTIRTQPVQTQQPTTVTVPDIPRPATALPAVLNANTRPVPVRIRRPVQTALSSLSVPPRERYRATEQNEPGPAGNKTVTDPVRGTAGTTVVETGRPAGQRPESSTRIDSSRLRTEPRSPAVASKAPTVAYKELPRDTVKRGTAATPKPEPKPKPKVDISTEPAPETRLSVYFTDGKGKFYSTSPQLRLTDAKSNAQVKQFYRTVDANGNPDPQAVAAGTYNLTVTSRSNLNLPKIVVQEGKNNKVIITVSNGSLRFRYDNSPNRPVSEFGAIVNIRFEDGPINQKQRCSEELEYAPGNYHVEINTLPVFQLNTDIDFGAITQIDIPEPGFVHFTNTNNIGAVQLFSPLGNRYMRFFGLRVLGNPEAQRVRLLPGSYEVHWVTNPGTPRAKEEVIKFSVRGNTVTEIEL